MQFTVAIGINLVSFVNMKKKIHILNFRRGVVLGKGGGKKLRKQSNITI